MPGNSPACTKTTIHILKLFFGTVGLLISSISAAAPDNTDRKLENTLDACRDGLDNDGDRHIDCDDQDCEVYVICHVVVPDHAAHDKAESSSEPPQKLGEAGDLCSDGIDNDDNGETDCGDDACSAVPWCPAGDESGPLCGDGKDNDEDGLIDCKEPSCLTSRYCEVGPEMGVQCQDGKDNDANGIRDCDEPSCQDSRFCYDEIFYVPEPPNKPMGLLLSMGLGFAFPNWSPPSGDVKTNGGSEYVIPYRPDVGPLADLSINYMFINWVGFGVKSMITSTGVQSRSEWSEEDFKFDGVKIYFHAGGFVRFQYPLDSIVPYANFALGYSYAQYRWVTYSRFSQNDGEETRRTLALIEEPPSHHMTFAIEPGIDVFILKRCLAAGIKAWLPIAATKDSSMDNTAVMLTFTYTPLWSEASTIKPKYLKP